MIRPATINDVPAIAGVINIHAERGHWEGVFDLRQGGTISIDGETFIADGRFLKDGSPG